MSVTLTIKNMKRYKFFYIAERKEKKRFRVPLNHVEIGRKRKICKYCSPFHYQLFSSLTRSMHQQPTNDYETANEDLTRGRITNLNINSETQT